MLRSLTVLRHVSANLPVAKRRLLTRRRGLLTLAIETSCDDTCVAILEKHPKSTGDASTWLGAAKLHFHEKVTADNTGHGGIHPLQALDSHRASLANLVQKSMRSLPSAEGQSVRVLDNEGTARKKPDFISVTRGPGMRSNLSCGLDTAKGLAAAWAIPMVGVHHMQAHALTPRLVHALDNSSPPHDPDFPFLNLLVSGGHTMLLHSTTLTSHSIVANSIDIAIGDCLDKCGRYILPPSLLATTKDTAYGKHLSNYAFPHPSTFPTYPIPKRRLDELHKPKNEHGWSLQLPLSNSRQMAFSFAGIPSHVERQMSQNPSMMDAERLLLARTVLGVSFEHLASRICFALESSRDIKTLVVSGGVAANDFLRWFLRAVLDARGFEGVRLVFPPVALCTDNAAMIAWAGMEMYEAGWRTGLDVGAVRKWSMDPSAEDGGILGLDGWYRD